MDNNPLDTNLLEDWWTKSIEGDRHAFQQIHRALFDGLYNYAMKMLKDGDLAGDAVQELFVKVWTRRDRIGTLQKVKSYFFTALRRQVLNQLRNLRVRELRISGMPKPDIGFSPEEVVVRDEEYRLLQTKVAALLNELPKRQKEVIYLHFFEAMDYTQIAEIMEINYQSVLNLTQKALQKLRSLRIVVLLWSLSAVYQLMAAHQFL